MTSLLRARAILFATVLLLLSTLSTRAYALDLDAGPDAMPAETKPVPDGLSVLGVQVDTWKRDYEEAHKEVIAIDRELSNILAVPNPKIDTAPLARALRELWNHAQKSAPRDGGAPEPGKATEPGKASDLSKANANDCTQLVNQVVDALVQASPLLGYTPFHYDGTAASPAVQTARNHYFATEREGQSVLTSAFGAYSRGITCTQILPVLEKLESNSSGGSVPAKPLGIASDATQSLNTLFETERKATAERANAYRTKLNELRTANAAAEAEALRKIAEAEARVRKEAGTQKKASDIDIIKIALFAMPLFVVVLFVGTAFFERKAQERLFAQRTVVELVGLALLLMTIIILGTNDKVEVPAMGALLGSIAGYVFSQQAQRLVSTLSNKSEGTGSNGQGNGPEKPSGGQGAASPAPTDEATPLESKTATAAAAQGPSPAAVDAAGASTTQPTTSPGAVTQAITASTARPAPARLPLEVVTRKLYTAAIAGLVVVGCLLVFVANDLQETAENDVKLYSLAVLGVFFGGGVFGVNLTAWIKGRARSPLLLLGIGTAMLVLLVFAMLEKNKAKPFHVSAKDLAAITACVLFGVATALGTSLWRRYREDKLEEQKASAMPPAPPATP